MTFRGRTVTMRRRGKTWRQRPCSRCAEIVKHHHADPNAMVENGGIETCANCGEVSAFELWSVPSKAPIAARRKASIRPFSLDALFPYAKDEQLSFGAPASASRLTRGGGLAYDAYDAFDAEELDANERGRKVG